MKLESKKLLIIPTPIGNMQDVSGRMREALASVDVLLCESFGKAKLLYQLLDIKLPRLVRYWQKTESSIINSLDDLKGVVGLVSDAGMPCISDPGYLLVTACHHAGWDVSVIPGPSAFVVGVVMSGIPCEEFQFLGFLPVKSAACQTRLVGLKESGISGVMYESPHRVMRLCHDILAIYGSEHQICVVKELSKKFETCYRGTVSEVIEQLEKVVIKGEFCVIISRAKPEPKWKKDAQLLKEYLSHTENATVCAKMHNVSRSSVYDYLLGKQ